MPTMNILEYGPMTTFDAVVIGGGPAGATYATLLARAGYHVAIVEGKKFPREHVGESLLASSMPILEELGLSEVLRQQNYVVKRGAIFAWGSAHSEIKLDMPSPGFAYQVQRPRFDQILLEHASDSGVVVFEECWAKEPLFDGDRAMGVLVAPAGNGAPRELRTKLLVDASGLFQFLPKRLDLPVETFGPRRAAITSYVEGAARYPAPYDGDIISEATRDGWLWFIPLTEQLSSVGFVGDERGVGRSPASFLAEQIASADIVPALTRDSKVVRKPAILKYQNHCVTSTLWQQGYILIGDSAIFVDPLFSTGVQGSLLSASSAAAASDSVLSGSVPEKDAAGWYDRKVRTHYMRVRAMIRLLYGIPGGDSEFWRSRDMAEITLDEAQHLLAEMGAAGIDFFQRTLASGDLTLPRALASSISDYKTRLRPTWVEDATRLTLGPEVELSSDFGVRDSTLTQVLVLKHLRNRAPELDLPASGVLATALVQLDGTRSVGEILGGLNAEEVNIEKFRLLLGALVDGGLLVELNDPSGSRYEEVRSVAAG